MFVNLSNHPIASWDGEQIESARSLYGDIVDMPFPFVPPDADESSIQVLVQEYAERIFILNPSAVHIMGEMTFCFALIPMLQRAGIPCYASTTIRDVTVDPDKGKISVFRFVRFRRYPELAI